MATREPMLDMFLFETTEMIEKLQQLMLESEKVGEISAPSINEIFRIMHTIKGSSGMMMYDNISHLAHSIEDMFYFIRENKPGRVDYSSLADLVLEGSDLIKEEIDKIDAGGEATADFSKFIENVNIYVDDLMEKNGLGGKETDNIAVKAAPAAKFYITNDKTGTPVNCFCAIIHFDEKCEMENIRSFTILHKLKEVADVVHYEPEDILENNLSVEIIKQQGFKMYFKTEKTYKEIDDTLQETIFLDSLELIAYDSAQTMLEQFQKVVLPTQGIPEKEITEVPTEATEGVAGKSNHKGAMISVDVHKLDMLMDLVGELVISESMVTNNPELKDVELDDFYKAVRQHRKRIADLQDVVMSMRMVSLAPTLNKMNRIVRDMCKRLDKKVELTIIGENTEVDKNIIEHIGDPLMHIIRNSMDHGIESEEIRKEAFKPIIGNITIEAKSTGGDVLIIVKDDGKGLNRDKILQRAIENGVVEGDGKHLSDKEIYATIFSPGLSTNDQVTEFSGRGVGMDVVIKEIEQVRGSVSVDSKIGEGTTTTIKIPLTIAILDGMIVRVGESLFTIPVPSIRQSIIVRNEEVFRDLDNREMLTIRGECFAIMRLHELYKLQTEVKEIEQGIVIMVEEDGKSICLFADELIGEQQVVIKALPEYISKVKGTSGCTLLGNGCISLILDVSQLVNI